MKTPENEETLPGCLPGRACWPDAHTPEQEIRVAGKGKQSRKLEHLKEPKWSRIQRVTV